MKIRLVTSNEILGGRFVVLVREERTGSTGDKRKMHYTILDSDLKTVFNNTSKSLLNEKVKELSREHQAAVAKEEADELEIQELEAAE
jgi:hypothetical protein